tara:strand:+ start:4241 stop:4762 length:522 start_codon:yes stop_codon:yes gene_type:complete
MAITGTKKEQSGGMRNYFVNECTIVEAEQIDSQYNDCSIKIKLEDKKNGYNYTCFVNQNFDKDLSGVVTGLKFPEDLNTLFLATGKDINVSDIGEVNIGEVVGSEVACINYASTGKYKRATWGVLSSLSDTDKLEEKFKSQLAKGYPKNFQSPQETLVEETFGGRAADSDVPF